MEGSAFTVVHIRSKLLSFALESAVLLSTIPTNAPFGINKSNLWEK